MSDQFPVIYAFLDLPRDESRYPKARHKPLLLRAERAAAALFSRYGAYLAPTSDQAKLWIETCLVYRSEDVRRGRGERLSKDRGRVTLDCEALDLPWPLAQVAASSLLIHEIGHVFGLKHCKDGCVMATPELAGWWHVLRYWLRRGTSLCDDCESALREVVVREGV